MRIDAHHHLWSLAREGQDWPGPDLPALFRDFAMADLAPHLAARGIDATILVQVCEDRAETDALLEIARADPRIAGVVGWLDLEAPDAAAQVAEAAREPLLVGLRPMVQGLADDDWLLRPVLAPAFLAMAAAGLVLDGLVRPRHLPRLAAVARRHPELRIVLDHGGKPDIAGGGLDPWRADVAALAACPNLACKLSGLATEAAPGWSADSLAPYVRHLLACFGPERLLWGSDWPVVNLAGGYAAWAEATDRLLADLAAAERDAVLGGTAARVYLSGRGRR